MTVAFRTFLQRCDDMPAFHAAMLVSTLLAAALLNIGFFLLLVAFRMLLDVLRLLDRPDARTRTVLLHVWSLHAFDWTLILLSISFVAAAPVIVVFFPLASLLRSLALIGRLFGIVVPRALLLSDAVVHDVHSRISGFFLTTLSLVSCVLCGVAIAAGSWPLFLKAVTNAMHVLA